MSSNLDLCFVLQELCLNNLICDKLSSSIFWWILAKYSADAF